MKKRITGIAIISLAAALAPLGALAAGPGTSITTSGVPSKWDNTRPIVFNIDQGPLGSITNSRAARDIVLPALDVWQNIDTARVQFEEGDPLDRDVTSANINDFLAGLPSDVNPIVFDQTGGVTDAFLGAGASRSTLAFGGILQSTPTGRIAQGIVVINGRAADGQFDPDDVATPELVRATVRAIGGMLNLGPSDVNSELIFDGNIANNTAVPIMHPTTVIGGGFNPTLDDRMSVSTMYPSTSFEANTGVIRGKVLLPDGTSGLQGIDVIARKVDDPINSAVSAISGATFMGTNLRGSRDPNLRGAFEIRVLPGNYTVEIRELRSNIGPLGQVFPLPGGFRYYQAAPAPSAGPADLADATPVTVTAGQATEINITTGGTAGPAPQTVAEAEPNELPTFSGRMPLNGAVTGNVKAGDPTQIAQDTGGGTRDGIEDLFRLDLPERRVVTLLLAPKDLVDLDLYVLRGILGGAASAVDASLTDGTEGEAIQIVLGPGTWYIGVTAWDNVQNAAATDYTLSISSLAYPEEPARPIPILDRLVVGNVTATGAEARWVTDLDTTGDALVSMPRQQFGDPNVGKAHTLTIGGLTAGRNSTLQPVSQVATGELNSLPKVYFLTARETPVEGPASLNASVIGLVGDTIVTGDTEQTTVLVALGIQNIGGNAANVQITGLTASPGWRLATPVTDPIAVGGIGSGATGIVVVRLIRDGTGPDPLATVTGTGTLAGADGATANFTIGGS